MKPVFKSYPANTYLRCMHEVAGKPFVKKSRAMPKRLEGGCLLFKFERLNDVGAVH